MTALDLSRPLVLGTPVYPGDPPVRLLPALTVAANGCAVTALSLGSHAGTHWDAPAHVLPGGATLDRLPLERFSGTAAAVDCRRFSGAIPPEALAGAPQADFLLLRTDWELRWGAGDYFTAHPHLSLELARALVRGGWKGVGLDVPSPDAPGSAALPVHRALLRAGVLILENLCNLDRLPREPFRLWAPPLLFQGADGAPVRAVAYWEE